MIGAVMARKRCTACGKLHSDPFQRCQSCRIKKNDIQRAYGPRYRLLQKQLDDQVPKPIYEPARMPCLRCDRLFDSFDKKINRICIPCNVEIDTSGPTIID